MLTASGLISLANSPRVRMSFDAILDQTATSFMVSSCNTQMETQRQQEDFIVKT
jgi:hypothetical protein